MAGSTKDPKAKALACICAALEVVGESDNYAMAVDGPVLHSREAMSNDQFDRMWELIDEARRHLVGRRR